MSMKLQITESQLKNLMYQLDEQETITSGDTKNITDTKGQDDMEKNNPNLSKFLKFIQSPLTSIAGAFSGNSSTGDTSTSDAESFSPNIPIGMELMHPLGSKYKVGSQFGPRSIGGGASKNHKGVDIPVPVGTPIYAAQDGSVVAAKDTTPNGCGGFVKLQHSGLNLFTKYCHLSRWTVGQGDNVKKGQLIGYSGGAVGALYSGNSQGPHLHYEVVDNGGIAMNPVKVHTDLA